MRPIDADAFEVLSWDDTGDTPYDQGFDDGVLFVTEKIDAAPTIDAIPVEWLKQQFYDNPNSQWAEKCRDVFTGWQKWQSMQKEQEAR